jgi:hypothetical protein
MPRKGKKGERAKGNIGSKQQAGKPRGGEKGEGEKGRRWRRGEGKFGSKQQAGKPRRGEKGEKGRMVKGMIRKYR